MRNLKVECAMFTVITSQCLDGIVSMLHGPCVAVRRAVWVPSGRNVGSPLIPTVFDTIPITRYPLAVLLAQRAFKTNG